MSVLSFLLAAAVFLPTAALLAQRPASSPGDFRTLATFNIEPPAADPHVSPDGRFVLLGTSNELLVYEVASRRTRKLADGRSIYMLEWSAKGDRIAWTQAGDDGRTNYVWSMPLDPKTAVPTAPAQRVTVGQAWQPAISVDGHWLAYAAPDSSQPGSASAFRNYHLSVVPVTGGPERVLAHFSGGVDYTRWSADGKSIYVNGTVVGEKQAVITKIYLDGRHPEVIRPGDAEWFVGMTADRRHLVLVPARPRVVAGGQAVVIDTTGREIGRVPLPEGAMTEYDDVLGDSALVWVGFKDRKSIVIGSLNGGQPKRVPVVGESNQSALWSPDGKHIVFQVREGLRTMPALMNADGMNVRVFRDHATREDAWVARWSPDSKYVIMLSLDGRPMLLDVAAKALRSIATDTTARIGNLAWGRDSRSLVAVMYREPATLLSIDELTLTGDRHKLLDIAAIPGRKGFQFVGDSMAYVRSDSAAFLVTLRGGSIRKLGDVPTTTQLRSVVVSPDGQWVAGSLVDARSPEVQQLEVTSLVTGERRLIEVPFRFVTDPRFTPDGRSIVVAGRPRSESTGARLYVVPINGSAARALSTAHTPTAPGISVSPDGQSIVYTTQEERTTSLQIIDLRPVLSRHASSRP